MGGGHGLPPVEVGRRTDARSVRPALPQATLEAGDLVVGNGSVDCAGSVWPPNSRWARIGTHWNTLGRSLERVERRTIQPLGKLMSVIAKAIADRQSEIERLQAEIKALNDVDKMLGTSAPAKPAARRSSSRRPAAAATPVAETASDAKPTRKRRPMTAEEKKAVSERMTASWAERRKKAAK